MGVKSGKNNINKRLLAATIIFSIGAGTLVGYDFVKQRIKHAEYEKLDEAFRSDDPNLLLSGPEKLHDYTKEAFENYVSVQATMLGSVLGSKMLFPEDLLAFCKKQNIEPKELVYNFAIMADKIDPNIIPEELIPLYRNLSKREFKTVDEFKAFIRRIQAVRSFEDQVPGKAMKKDWREYKEERVKRVKGFERSLKIGIPSVAIKNLILRDRAKRMEFRNTSKENIAKARAYRPQHRA